MKEHLIFLDIACDLGRAAKLTGEENYKGAVLIKDGLVVACSRDRRRELNDPIATAELDCIRRAGRRNDQPMLTMVITDLPDMLAAGTILQFSIGSIVIGTHQATNTAVSLLESKGVAVNFIPHEGCIQLNA